MISMTRKAMVALLSVPLLAGGVSVSAPATAQEALLGAIDFVGFNFPPRGWTQCDGQILPINSNQSLYSLLGTTFAGDGRTSFALPDMRGRSPIHDGGSAGGGLTQRQLGAKGGAEVVVLTTAEIPSHTHTLKGTTSTGNRTLPTGNALADDAPDETYRDEAPNASMGAGSIGSTPGGSHNNMAPYLTINCIIALQGIFPSRN